MSTATMTSSSNWDDRIEYLGRFGYAAKGVIYFVIGVLAAQAAFSGFSPSGSDGAIREIAQQPFGRTMLAILAVGLGGYVLWRFAQAFLDPEDKGNDAKAIILRIAYFISGFSYTFLAVTAASVALGMGMSGSGDSKEDWTAALLSVAFGRWIVGFIGAIVIGVGIYNLVRSITAKFMEKYKRSEMSSKVESVALYAGRAGYAARAVTFSIIGGFLIVAAYRADPDETKGLSGALQTLSEQTYGPWLLAVVAVGVVAYGVHCLVYARYRRFRVQFD